MARLRILVVDTYYPAFLAVHYDLHPGLETRDYSDQLQSLMERCFGTSDAYSRYFRRLGHEAEDLVANCQPLQLRWAHEHGVPSALSTRARSLLPGRLDARARLREIALAQIAEFDPEVVYLQDLWFFTPGDLDGLGSAGRLVAGQIASRPPNEARLRRFDLLTTSFPHYVDRFRGLGIDAEFFKIAFYELVLERLKNRGIDGHSSAPRSHRVTFVGGLNPNLHSRGVRLLERLSSEIELDIWGYGAEALPADSPIRDRYRGQAWGLDMYEILARSQITVNRHLEAAEGYANNMRLFEATGVGALLATDDGKNLCELFRPGGEVVSYESEDDAIRKLRHLLEHDDERLRIAAAGQERTLREHTYARRIPELAEMLEARLR
jgi:spore maturation protein CgeB